MTYVLFGFSDNIMVVVHNINNNNNTPPPTTPPPAVDTLRAEYTTRHVNASTRLRRDFRNGGTRILKSYDRLETGQ